MNYRSDIDGLRAIAVILVILFHAGLEAVPGGFIGVDVFLVISGYLITDILLANRSNPRFTLTDFWVRRVRRLLPALVTVMAACAVAFAFTFSVYSLYYYDLAKSLVAQSVFLSNFLFWLQSGYFDSGASVKPLLHTWSLALEGQFYVIYPLILWATWRWNSRWGARLLVTTMVTTFTASVVLSAHYPVLAFYLLPTRLWEFGVGAFIAWINRNHTGALLSKKTNEIAALCGVCAIVITALVLTRLSPFPSYMALPPVAGTALVLWANRSGLTAVGRALSCKPIVAIGLMSYSVYLWHWPAIVMNRSLQLITPSVASNFIAVAIAVVPAYLSYRFIEVPLRRPTSVVSNKVFLCGMGIILFCLAGWGTYVFTQGQIVRESSDNTFKKYDQASRDYPRIADCGSLYNKDPNNLFCSSVGSTQKPKLLIWGDSHADALLPAFDQVGQKTNTAFTYTSLRGCVPATAAYLEGAASRSDCIDYMARIKKWIAQSDVATVIMAFRIEFYVNELSVYEKGEFTTRDKEFAAPDEAFEAFSAEFTDLVKMLQAKGIKVYMVTDIPAYNINVPEYLMKSMRGGIVPDYAEPRDVTLQRTEKTKALLNRLGVSTISLIDAFCDKQLCHAFKDGVGLYKDDDHLNEDGAALAVPILIDKFAAIKTKH